MTTARRPRATRAVAGGIAAAVVAFLFAITPVSADTASQLKAAKAKVDRLLNQIEQEQKTVAHLTSEANDLAIQIDQVVPCSETYFMFSAVTLKYEGTSQKAVSP